MTTTQPAYTVGMCSAQRIEGTSIPFITLVATSSGKTSRRTTVIWVYYDMGRGGSPVDPGSFWRDPTPAGTDRDYNDYDDYGYDDPSGGPGGSGGHYGSHSGGYYYGTPGRDDYIPYVYGSDIELY